MILYYENKLPDNLAGLCEKKDIELVDVNEKVLGTPIIAAIYRELGIEELPALTNGGVTITGSKKIIEYISGQSQ